jgi:hypothetical protein
MNDENKDVAEEPLHRILAVTARILTLAWRLILVLLLIAAAVPVIACLANFLYDSFAKGHDRLQPWLGYGSATVTVAALIKFIDPFLKGIWNVVQSATKDSVTFFRSVKELSARNVVAYFLIIFSIVVFERHRDDFKEKSLHCDVVYLGKDDTTPDYYVRLPIMFERARFDESIVSLDERDVSKYVFTHGITYDEVLNRNMLEELVKALRPCGAPDGSRPVKLIVEGYASSEPFHEDGDKAKRQYVYSERLNLRTADERGDAVRRKLDELIGKDSKLIRVLDGKPWDTIQEMGMAREFHDRPLGLESGTYPQDLMTRTAHIKIKDAGMCSVDSASRPDPS